MIKTVCFMAAQGVDTHMAITSLNAYMTRTLLSFGCRGAPSNECASELPRPGKFPHISAKSSIHTGNDQTSMSTDFCLLHVFACHVMDLLGRDTRWE